MSEISEDVMKAAIAAVSQDGWSIDGKSAYSDPGDSVIAMIDIMPIARAILAERERSRTALSEAEQRVNDAKRIATNAEHYGYMHGVQAAADIAAELADAQKQAWDEHLASGVKTNATSFHAIFSELASRIRALIPSEPHDAAGRETPRRGDPSIFDDAEGRN